MSPFSPASRIAARPLTFLWNGRFPLGKLAILDGDPGLGKSFVTLDFCARVTTGRPFPNETAPASPSPAAAIVLNAEDTAHGIMIPRLEALGANLDRVHVHNLDSDDDPLRFPGGITVLDHALIRTAAKLVVIDPIVAFLDPHVQLSSDISVRLALQPLARLAEKHLCVILLVRHLNKNAGQNSLYRGGGSIGFLAACRTAWLVAPDPVRPAARIFAQVKNNLAPPQPSLGFEIKSEASSPTPELGAGLPTPPPSSPLAIPVWRPGIRPYTADQLLSRMGCGPAFSRPVDRAADFLTSILDEGPRPVGDIWDASQLVQLSERTIKRAKKKLEINSCRAWVNGRSVMYWLLPGQLLSRTIAPARTVPDLEPWLRPLRERFPSKTPLDEE